MGWHGGITPSGQMGFGAGFGLMLISSPHPSLPVAFLSWFRNGLLASGIGVISFMQSDMGREAAYGECRPPPRPHQEMWAPGPPLRR